jgi:hypothetical protein
MEEGQKVSAKIYFRIHYVGCPAYSAREQGRELVWWIVNTYDLD